MTPANPPARKRRRFVHDWPWMAAFVVPALVIVVVLHVLREFGMDRLRGKHFFASTDVACRSHADANDVLTAWNSREEGVESHHAGYFAVGFLQSDTDLPQRGLRQVAEDRLGQHRPAEVRDVVAAGADGAGQAEGVQRRLEIKGEIRGATVIDDYGHHPTEIKATLKALEDAWPDRRKVVVFQPHRYTRTRDLFNDFTRAFYQSDLLLVMPIYSAGEDKIDGVDGHNLCEDIMAHGHKQVICVKDMNEAVACLRDNLMDRDIVLTLGAGDVWMVGEKLLEKP